MLSTDILQPFTCLKLGTFINNIKYGLTINIYNINKNAIVEINVVF